MHPTSAHQAKAGAWEALLLAVDSAGGKQGKDSAPEIVVRARASGTSSPRASVVPLQHTVLKRKSGLLSAFKRLQQKPPSCWQHITASASSERVASPQPQLATPCISEEFSLGTRGLSAELLMPSARGGTPEPCALAARLDAVIQQRAAFWQQLDLAPATQHTATYWHAAARRSAGQTAGRPVCNELGAPTLQPELVLDAVLGNVPEEDAGPLLAARRFLAQF